MKTPIYDPKFSNVSVSKIVAMMDQGSAINTYRFFSGATELSLSKYNFTINSHTQRPAIAEFWYCLFEDPELIYHRIIHKDFIPTSEMEFKLMQKTFLSYKSVYYRAALFFVLNRCSNLGSPSRGGFDSRNLTRMAMNRLRTFRKPDNFNLHYQEDSNSNVFSSDIACDYVLFPNLIFNYNLMDYGKSSSFDSQIISHNFLKDYLLSERKKTILIYNNHPALLDFFQKFNITLIDRYGNISNNSTNYEEAIVTNF